MPPDHWRRVSAIFHGTLALPPEARQAYLEAQCGTESGLRRDVERLLAAHVAAGRFGDAPVDPDLGQVPHAPGRQRGLAAAPPLQPPRSKRRSPRRHRFTVLAAIMAGAVAAALAYACWLLITGGGVTSEYGWRAAARGDGWLVTAVDEDGPAGRLRPGDRILEVDGREPLPDAGVRLHLLDLGAGDTYTLDIERGGERRRLVLEVGAAPITSALVYLATSLVWCAVGLFIGFAKPDAALPRLACLAAIATGLVLLQVGVLQGGPLWQPLHAVLGFHFLARFPLGQPTRGWTRAALLVAYLVGAVPAGLGLLAIAALHLGGPDTAAGLLTRLATPYELRSTLGMIAFAIAVFGMVLSLAHNYRALDDEDLRRRVRWIVLGGIVALIPQVWWAVTAIVERLSGIPIPRFDLFANAFTVAIPVVTAYAVVRHRVLDIKLVVRRGVQYLLARRALQAAATVPFFALAIIVVRNRDLTLGELATETQGYLYWLVLAALVLRFRETIGLWLDRRFFREQHDREQLVLRLIDESPRVESLDELARLIGDALARAMHPASAFIWYRDPEDRATTAASSPLSVPAEFPADRRWLAWLERHRGTASLSPPLDTDDIAPADRSWLRMHGIDRIVPIGDGDDRLIGALLLGAKMSDEPYDDNDSRFLQAIAKQAGVIRENLRLRARLGDEARVRHDVLARLDPRLPGVLKECPLCGACFDGAVERCPEDGRELTLSLPVPRTIDERYRLERLLGKGGMGAVYEARDTRLERTVALKVMPSRAFGRPDALRRFRREARAAARLSHPNIVTVFDVASLEGGGAYIVMERIAGRTLRAALDADGPLPPALAAEWLGPLLDGLAAAHAHGIVHRDLKPENVMGHRAESGELAVKILDLGLVKLRSEEPRMSGTITVEGIVMGTPDYMAPEQLLGLEVDHRADIFAVGVLVLETLTGQRTWRDERPTGALAPEWPPELAAVLRRCLAVDPDGRPDSAEQLKAELLPLLTRPSS